MITAVEKAKIIELNEKLRHEEIRIENYYQKMRTFFNDVFSNQLFDDINWQEKFSLFSSNEDFNKKFGVEVGDPFITEPSCLLGLMRREEGDNDVLLENWSEGNTVEGLHICYLMHILLYDSVIKIEDLLFIEDVWFEIKLDVQYMLNKEEL